MSEPFQTGLTIAGINLVGMLLIYSVLAFALTRLGWRDRGMAAVLLMIIIAQLFWLVPTLLILGLTNADTPAAWTIWFGNWLVASCATVVLWQAVRSIPRQMEDSARVDGCGSIGTFWHVILPFVWRELGMIATLTLMATLLPYWAFISTPDAGSSIIVFQRTPPPATQIGMMIAGSLSGMLPVIAIFFLVRRRRSLSTKRCPLFRTSRFDFDLDGDVVADHPLAAGALPYPEVAPFERRSGNAPAGSRILRGGRGIAEQLDVQDYWMRHTMHRQVTNDLPRVRAGLLHPAALEGDLRIFAHIEEIRGAQMLVAFRVCSIDARRLNRRNDRGFFGMIAIDLNRPAKFGELALRASQHVPDLEGDRGIRRVELEGLIRLTGGATNHQTETKQEEQARGLHRQGCSRSSRPGKRSKVTCPLPSLAADAGRATASARHRNRSGAGVLSCTGCSGVGSALA